MSTHPNNKRTIKPPVPPTTYEKQSAGASSSTTTMQLFPYTPSGEAKRTLYGYQLESIKELHRECLGRPMPSPISAAVLRDLYAETPAAYYKYALREAMYAPRPSWRYVEAIVKRCKAQLIEPSELEY